MGKMNLDTGLVEGIMAMSKGNIGAANALSEMAQGWLEADPQSGFASFAPLWFLDTLEIYGADIHVLWKDCCECKVERVVMLSRAIQIGLIDCYSVVQASHRYNHGKPQTFDWEVLAAKLVKEFPDLRIV